MNKKKQAQKQQKSFEKYRNPFYDDVEGLNLECVRKTLKEGTMSRAEKNFDLLHRGENALRVSIEPTVLLFWRQLFRPMILAAIFGILILAIFPYYFIAIFYLIQIVIVALLQARATRKAKLEIAELAKETIRPLVLTMPSGKDRGLNGNEPTWVRCEPHDLVPGDLVQIEQSKDEHTNLCCDCALVKLRT